MIYSSMCMGFYYSFNSAFLYNFKMKEWSAVPSSIIHLTPSLQKDRLIWICCLGVMTEHWAVGCWIQLQFCVILFHNLLSGRWIIYNLFLSDLSECWPNRWHLTYCNFTIKFYKYIQYQCLTPFLNNNNNIVIWYCALSINILTFLFSYLCQ